MHRRHRPLSTSGAAAPPRHHLRTGLVTGLLLALLLTLLGAPPGVAQTTTSDALAVAKSDDDLSNSEVAVRLSQGTPLTGVTTAVIGRDDVFADSLASGVLQADSPLLLVPPQGPVPPEVMDELERMGASTLILLGGTGAIDPAVEEAFATAGYAVQRREGPTRLETATAIAATDAADADTVVLARAFAAEGATDPTQQFADALAAGGMAAENRWPILLTQTEVLSASTREYLADSTVRNVLIMGGTAAISAAVEEELLAMGMTVERLAGNDRFETAIEVAGKRDAESAADVARVTLVEAQDADAWAGGFAAAAHSAFWDAPIVLANRDSVPTATRTWLQGGAAPVDGFAVDPDDPEGFPVMTCVTPRAACETARVALRLPATATITTTPAEGSAVHGGQVLGIALEGSEATTIAVDGSCVDGLQDVPVTAGEGQVRLAGALEDAECELVITLTLSNGASQTTTLRYPTGAAGFELLTLGVDDTAVGGELPAVDASGDVVAFISEGALVEGVPAGERRTYVHRNGSAELLDRRPDGTPATAGVGFTEGPPDVAAEGGHVAFMANDDQLAGSAAVGWPLPVGYVTDLASGEATPVTLDLSFEPADRAAHIQVSGDGSAVAYWGRTGDGTDYGILHRDLVTGAVDAVRLPDGSVFEDSSGAEPPALSADGRWIAFYTDTALVAEDTNEATDAYLYDRAEGVLERVSVTDEGGQADAESFNSPRGIDVSGDGRLVAFVSDATNLADGDDGGGPDVFVRDRTAGTTTLISRGADGAAAGDAERPSISPGGQHVAFTSGQDLTAEDRGGCGLYLGSAAGDRLQRVDPATTEALGGTCPFRTGVGDGGQVVADVVGAYDPRDGGDRDVYRSPPADG